MRYAVVGPLVLNSLASLPALTSFVQFLLPDGNAGGDRQGDARRVFAGDAGAPGRTDKPVKSLRIDAGLANA